MRRLGSVGSMAAAMVLIAASSAPAATVGQERFLGTLDVRAEPGEANAITIEVSPAAGEDSEVVVTDAGAPLEAGDECELRNDGSVACEADLYIVTVTLGDEADTLGVNNTDGRVQHTVYGDEGDDDISVGPQGEVCVEGGEGDDHLAITTPSEACIVDGGDGEDVVSGSDGYDRLYGGDDADELDAGPGEDYLTGGPGDDVVHGGDDADSFIDGGTGDDTLFGDGGDDGFDDGEGDDVMRGGGGADGFSSHFQFSSGDDVYIGGPGLDHMGYFCPRCALSLDGGANDGLVHRGERDNVQAESASIASRRKRGDEIPPRSYGTGEDQMVGDDGPNRLSSFRGSDILEGLGGHDVLDAGVGADLVKAADGEPDVVRCGQGPDRAVVDKVDDVRGCEFVSR